MATCSGAAIAAAAVTKRHGRGEALRRELRGGQDDAAVGEADLAVAASVTVSLMLISVLPASWILALERDEHAVGRLAMLGEKVLLAATRAFAVTLVMLCGIGTFVHLDWGLALRPAALAAGAVAFAALGVAIGAPAREVRAASLPAFLPALPIPLPAHARFR
jgi:hypothetical protein